MTSTSHPLLSVRDLGVRFQAHDSVIHAVNGISFDLEHGQTLGLVGESGSGKSQTVLALMGLLARNGQASGHVRLDGQELLGLPVGPLNRLRGNRMAMIFQDAMTALNPYLSIERQMTEVLEQHRSMTRRAARTEAIAMLEAVRIPDAARRIDLYPHEFSGGMRQRVMIAMALLCRPDVLIADEPTTALDVTVQAQILSLLRDLQSQFGTAIIMITHDLGVVAGLCEQIIVLYGGRVMEQGAAASLFARPSHPYTRGLLAAVPRMDDADRPLVGIPGEPPDMSRPPPGCPFAPRCPGAQPRCHEGLPLLAAVAGESSPWPLQRACHLDAATVRAWTGSQPQSALEGAAS
ncbi:ABC transporter ATP-binding protein [Amphibiibacter pelophylacis]|uniref:ATP-binding cassette domain-containing protein n=1 Tax=Amphibiibacter pelophylacis TaxID=1799477 RepID=A0ACC6P2N0_9BURK